MRHATIPGPRELSHSVNTHVLLQLHVSDHMCPCVVMHADMTMSNDRSFWSSTGHASQVAHEALLYELSGPACQVASIKLAPYRALYQDG